MPDYAPLPPDCNYPADPNFPTSCGVDYSKAYCCMNYDTLMQPQNFISCTSIPSGTCTAGTGLCHMTFPFLNDEKQPTLKTALSGTAITPWVRITFQEFAGTAECIDSTANNIITMGNLSEPFADKDAKCNAIITEFQYGWGAINQGNRVRIKIMDQKGATFQRWVERMAINPEGDTTPIQGKYRMKVQFGWYTSGGADSDVCGQQAIPVQVSGGILPIGNAPAGFNTAFIICSPVMYFITDWINVHYENGKFNYELEGTDTLVRGQEYMVKSILGQDRKQMYFTKACQLVGAISTPPFRVEFKAIDNNGKVVPLEFAPRGTPNNVKDRLSINDQFAAGDCDGYGPYGIWSPYTRSPIESIKNWIIRNGIVAKDLTGKATSNGGAVSITMNYDPIYKYNPSEEDDPECGVGCTGSPMAGNIPNYGRLILWQNGIPYCQGNFNEVEINNRVKAVYVVNGGNCSPVIHFAPSFRWHSQAAQRATGSMTPIKGTQNTTNEGAVRAGCQIASGTGSTNNRVTPGANMENKVNQPGLATMNSTYHHIMTNLMIGAIEADLRVQGDPSDWLCSPALGYGRCVGIVFINPYFLVDNGQDCPDWAAGDPTSDNPEFKSACNQLLTNKGWFVMGVDHQIKGGQYITTLRLKLIAPGAELNPAGSITNLGGWGAAAQRALPYGGQSGCLSRFLIGNAGTAWGSPDYGFCGQDFIGGGTPCSPRYDSDAIRPED